MENKLAEKFLPIGTVVLLKNGIKELMITSYCPIPKGNVYDKSGKVDLEEGKMFDYGACFYPEGIIKSQQTFVFNHDQIERVCFKGYETEAQKKFSDTIKEELAKKEKESK